MYDAILPQVTYGRSKPPEQPSDQLETLIIDDADLEEDILLSLGTVPGGAPNLTAEFHLALSSRWNHIITNGLESEVKKNLLASYSPPQNCTNLSAPLINPELSSALSAISLKKDKYQEEYQNQLGIGLCALGSALSSLLSEGGADSNWKEKVVVPLGNAGQILTDLFFRLSQARRSFIVPNLNKIVKDLAEKTPPTRLLFGDELGEKIKAAKALEKNSEEIRAPRIASRISKPETSRQQTSRFYSTKPKSSPKTLNLGGPARQRREPRRQGPNPHPPPRKTYNYRNK